MTHVPHFRSRRFSCFVHRHSLAAATIILGLMRVTASAAELTTVRFKSGFDPVFEQTGGPVRFIEPAPGGKLYIGGDFSTFDGAVQAPLARLNADATRDVTFTPPVHAPGPFGGITVLPDGRLLVVGPRANANNYGPLHLQRLDANGVIDPTFAPEINSSPGTVVVQPDGKILIAGGFTLVNGVLRPGVARLHADGTLDESFNPSSGPDGSVLTMALQADGRIVIGGTFRIVSNVGRAYVARLNASGTVDETFNAGTGTGLTGFPSGTSIRTIAVQADQKILVGGSINTFNGETRRGLIRLNPDGSGDTTFVLPAEALRGGLVNKVRVDSNGKILVTGTFNSINGGVGDGVVRLMADGSVDVSFSAPPTTQGAGRNGTPLAAITLSDGRVLVAGGFTEAGVRSDVGVGTTHLGLMRLSNEGVLDEAFAPELRTGAFVRNIWACADGGWLVTGDFRFVDGVARPGLARITAAGELDATFNPGPLFDVLPAHFAVQPDGKIVAAGAFSTFDSAPANGILRLNTDGTRDAGFVTGTGFDAAVTSLGRRTDGKLLVAGGFSTYNGTPRNTLALLETTGALDGTFDPGTGLTLNAVRSTNPVLALFPDNAAIISGSFDSYNGTARLRMVRILSSGVIDPTFDTSTAFQFISPEFLLPLADGKVVCGSQGFMQSPINAYIFRLNADGTKDSSFLFSSSASAAGPLGPLQANGKFYLATTSGLVRVTDTGAVDSSFAISTIPTPSSLLVLGTALDANGQLAMVNTTLAVVQNASVPRINGSLELTTTVGEALNYPISATNNPTTFQAEYLPAGLTLDANTGIISGASSYAGLFSVNLTATNAEGPGRARLILRVNKAVANVTIGNATQTYNGQPRPVTVSTTPTGLNVVVSYSGSPLAPPTNAGSYAVNATVNDPNYSGTADVTLTVEKASAALSFDQTNYPHNGSPRPVTVTTTPAGLAATITYDGTPTAPTAQGTYALAATVDDPNYAGSLTGTLRITPAITPNQSGPVNTPAGGETTLGVTYAGGANVTYQWQIERPISGPSSGSRPFATQWIDLPSATSATFTISSTQNFNAGNYRVVVTEGGISVPSDPIVVTVAAAAPNTARLLNLSTRGLAQSGDNVLIPGFVINGTGTKKLLIRAVGPTLGKPPFNLESVLQDPRMRLLKRNTGTGAFEEIATNDNWGSNANAAAITQTAADLFAFAFNDDRESALLTDLTPGEYTVIAGGVNDVTGLAIVELYDADTGTPTSRLVNISNRGFAGAGDQVMIPGFVVSSEGPKTLLVRVVGPTLGTFGVGGTMTDPKLEVFPGGGTTPILTNDNWGDNPDAAYTAQVAQQVQAFPLAAGSKDAAFVVTLPPGSYTVVGSSAIAGATGVVLVEVYVVP